MKIDNKIMIALVHVLCAAIAIFAYLNVKDMEKELKDTDAIKFKEEYEAINEEENSIKMEISEDNPIEYADYDKLLEIINNGTGIIYLGFPGCPWCRNALPVLFDVAKDNNVEIIYYMNILNERDSFVVEDKKLVYAIDDEGNEKRGTKGYKQLLKALDKHLTEYIVSFEGKEYKTGEKRIYAPTVIFVKDGKVVGLHVSTVESQENPREGLSKKQYKELYEIYEDYILETLSGTCSIGTSC